MLEWIVIAIHGTISQSLVCLIPACGFFVVGIVSLVQIDSRVYIDEGGIHITWRNGAQLLIPRENLPNCRLIIEGRAQSTIYVFPEREYYLKFGLECMLRQIKRGNMTKEDLMTQPIIFLQFGLMGNSMRRFYQEFLLIWKKRQESN